MKVIDTLRQLWKSRTVRFSLLIAVLSVLQGYVFLLEIKPIYQMFVGLGLSLVVFVLRLLTDKPVSAK